MNQDKKVSILIIDSERTELETLHIGFQLEGFNVASAVYSEQAQSLLEHHHFDVVIVDLMMPSINGLQLARFIREKSATTEIIMMSTYHLWFIKDRDERLRCP